MLGSRMGKSDGDIPEPFGEKPPLKLQKGKGSGLEIKMQWYVDNRSGTAYLLRLGNKWYVGGYHYNSLRNRDDPKCYKVTCRLPGLKDDLGDYETHHEAQARLEKAAVYWLEQLHEG